MGNGARKSMCPSAKTSISAHSASQHDNGNQDEEVLLFNLKSVRKQIIVDSWHNVDDKMEFIERVFAKIFSERPSLKIPFRLHNFSNSDEFRHHIRAFSDFLSTIIDNLHHDEKKAYKSADKLGRAHVKFVSKELFNLESVNTFASAIVDCFEHEQKTLGDEYHGTKMTKHILETWTLFLNSLFNIMLKGYNETNVTSEVINVR